MCGRYYVDTEEDIIEIREIINELNRKYMGTETLEAVNYGEVFPTNLAPVIAIGRGGITPGLMAWGFPKWDGTKGVIINARAETAAEKPMFKSALMERRVVVPTTGFYEWKHEGKKATDKLLFRLPDTKMLYLCGIYSMFAMPSGEKEARFTILTTAANSSMSPYHDRMPVMLSPDERDRWLTDKQAVSEIICRRQPELIATPA